MQGSYQSKKEMQVFNFPGVGINDTMEYISKTCIKHGNDICPNFTFLGMILDTLKHTLGACLLDMISYHILS